MKEQTMPEFFLGSIYTLSVYRDLMRTKGLKNIPLHLKGHK